MVNELGVKPEQITDYMGIVGDTSDNIPGVKGIGDKGASTLIKEYHSLDNIYANIDSVKNPSLKEKLIKSKELAFLSRELATLKTDLSIKQSWEDFKTPSLDAEKIAIFLSRGYNVIHRDLAKEIGASLVTEKTEEIKSKQFEELHRKNKLTGSAEKFGAASAILLGDLALIWAAQMFHSSKILQLQIQRALPIYDEMRVELMVVS